MWSGGQALKGVITALKIKQGNQGSGGDGCSDMPPTPALALAPPLSPPLPWPHPCPHPSPDPQPYPHPPSYPCPHLGPGPHPRPGPHPCPGPAPPHPRPLDPNMQAAATLVNKTKTASHRPSSCEYRDHPRSASAAKHVPSRGGSRGESRLDPGMHPGVNPGWIQGCFQGCIQGSM